MIYLREAGPKDIDLIYKWANDPIVRRQSFNSNPIPFEDHRKWYIRVLADRDTLLLIMCDDTKKANSELGQIRLAIEDDKALISYTISEENRGKGYGARIILMAEEYLRQERVSVHYCIAQVKKDNLPSLKVFEKCGYDDEETNDYIEFTKRIS